MPNRGRKTAKTVKCFSSNGGSASKHPKRTAGRRERRKEGQCGSNSRSAESDRQWGDNPQGWLPMVRGEYRGVLAMMSCRVAVCQCAVTLTLFCVPRIALACLVLCCLFPPLLLLLLLCLLLLLLCPCFFFRQR